MNNTQPKFTVGQRAQKVGGSFQAYGTIVSVFNTLDGAERYVFEFDVPAGMLHIYGPAQLEPLALGRQTVLTFPVGEAK